MNSLASGPASARAELFNECAARLGIPAALIEKDFWVCWLLMQLFTIPEMRARLVFKGGTSLSKIFKAIQRFSEDIDLIVDFEALGYVGDRHPSKAPSKNKHGALLKEMLATCRAYIEGEFLSLLDARLRSILGDGDWSLRTRATADGSAVVEFAYPPAVQAQLQYVRPVVLLEPGTHAEGVPQGTYTLRSFAAEEFPQLFEQPEVQLNAITIERTFWEKATILHAEHHRPAEKRLGARHSRHYYDLAMLLRGGFAESALANAELRERVVRHKVEFYASAWARYDLAKPGTFRLLPSADRVDELRRDYEQMQVMIFGVPPSFGSILSDLGQLESRINQTP